MSVEQQLNNGTWPLGPPKIIFSSANLVHADYMHFTLSEIDGIARRAGFDGVEWHPFYHSAGAVGRAIVSQELRVEILHQSAYGNREVRDITGEPVGDGFTRTAQRVPALGKRFIGPGLFESADYMREVRESATAKIQDERGAEWKATPLPAVFYPLANAQEDADLRGAVGAKYDLAQPSNKLARRLGVSSVRQLTETLVRNGYGPWYAPNRGKPHSAYPYMLNTTEMRRRYGQDDDGIVSNPASLKELAANATGLQVSVGHAQLAEAEAHIPTMQELQGLTNGYVRGPLRDIFIAAQAVAPLEFVVLRAPATGIIEATGHHHVQDVERHYGVMAAALRNYFTQSS